MSDHLENIPAESPEGVEQVVELTQEEREKLAELAVMLKAYKLFSNPRADGDPYRAPDDVQTYELITEVMSFLREKEGRRRLVYRRLLSNDELILDSQVIEFREFDGAMPVVITCDRYPETEVPSDMIREVEEFLDYHLERYELNTDR